MFTTVSPREAATETTRIRTGGRRARQIVTGTLTALVSMLALSGTPAHAVSDNSPNYTVAGMGVAVSVTTSCDTATRTMSVSATTSTMQTYGYAGGITWGPYDNGQWVRYTVLARDTSGGTWTQMYAWSNWRWITGVTSTMNVERMATLTDLGTNLVKANPGHAYETAVSIDYWTGKDNVASFNSTYSQLLKLNSFNTYPYSPSRCAF